MIFIYIVILAGIFGAIGQYLDKHLVNMGISRKDYFYYMCLTMIPFSIIMVIIEYFTNQLKFEFGIIPIILLLLAMFFKEKDRKPTLKQILGIILVVTGICLINR